MKTFLKTTYGSRLYGTHTSNSDFDTRSVEYPSVKSLLGLGSEKNTQTVEGMNDNGSFPLRHFVSLLVRGTPNVTEMLFSDRRAWQKYDDSWLGFYKLARQKLVSQKSVRAFLGYAQNDAAWSDKETGKLQSGKLRVLWQAESLCRNGSFSYPAPLYVKEQRFEPLPDREFSTVFADCVANVERALKTTELRALPDTEWANEWLVNTMLNYLRETKKELLND
jgi:hypothetical protein